MENNKGLFNAAVIGENPNTSFIVEGKYLHAVEPSVAALEKGKADPKQVLPLIRDALKALIKFAEGKVEEHFLEIDWKAIAGKPNEQIVLIKSIHEIFSHLPHVERNNLSSMIHHKQSSR